MISMELAVYGDIPLGVWIVTLPWPFNCISHGFHDGYTFDGLDIEGVFGDPSSVPMVWWVVIGFIRWPLKWATAVVCEPTTWIGRVRLCGTRCGSLI